VLIFEVEGTFVGLFSSLRSLIFFLLFLEEKLLILKAFLLERESLISGRVLVGDLVVLGGELIRAP